MSEGGKIINLDDFISSIISSSPSGKSNRQRRKEKKRRQAEGALKEEQANAKRPSDREIRLARLSSPRWQDEAIVLLVTKSHCLHCGGEYSSPHAFPFIRRFHPIYRIHEQALGLRPSEELLRNLPQRIETREIEVPCCHLCFGLGGELPLNQLSLPLFEEDGTEETGKENAK